MESDLNELIEDYFFYRDCREYYCDKILNLKSNDES